MTARAVLVLMVFMAVVPGAWAQTRAAPAEFVVRDLRVEGLQRISEGTVYNYLPINPGDRLTRARLASVVTHHDRCSAASEPKRDGTTDTCGPSCHYRYAAVEVHMHHSSPSCTRRTDKLLSPAIISISSP